MTNGNAIIYPGLLPANVPDLGKIELAYVAPLADATYYWSSRQLPAGKIPVWADRVSGIALEPPVPSQAPTVYAGLRKVVRFIGSPERVSVPLPLTAPMTFIIVAGLSDPVVTGGSRYLTYGYDNGSFWNLYEGVNGKWAFSAGKTLASTVTADTGRHVFIVSYDGTAKTVLSVDGVEVTGDAGATPAGGFRIGATATAYFKSDVEAIAILPYAADAVKRAAILKQMKRDYNFAV